MALTRSNQFDSGTVLTESALEGEFDAIYSGALNLISPLTGSLAAGDNDITGIDEVAFTDAAAAASVAGRLRRNVNNLAWHDRTGSVALQPMIGGGLYGLTLSNAADAVNDISIAVGAAVDSVPGTVLRLTSVLVKQLDAAWAVGTNAGGLDTGSIANTTYHVHLIQRTDTGVVDALFSTSATAPTMPTSYTLRRRIGSIVRSAGTILAFTQDGDLFVWPLAVLDVSATDPGTAAVTRTLTVPAGITVLAVMNVHLERGGTSATVTALLTDMAATDVAPAIKTATQGQLVQISDGATTKAQEAQVTLRTNTSAQIRSRLSVSEASTVLAIATQGWYDTRQKDA